MAKWKGFPWVGGSAVLIVGALAVLFFTIPKAETMTFTLGDLGGDISAGPRDARVVVVEYADFECTACAYYASFLGPLRVKYQDRVLFVFKFLPLPDHPFGMISAQAAYAAFRQGKFWEMYDLLYQNQEEWANSSNPQTLFDMYAQELGLDLVTFHDDMLAQTTIDFLTRERAEAKTAGVTHTPWFVVNGAVVQPQTAKDFEAVIVAGLK